LTFSYFEHLILERNSSRLEQVITNVKSRRIILSEGEDESEFLRDIYQKKFSAMIQEVLNDL
jgi:hypothetical protein